MKVVAVSACPSGLMHTYMAAESLKKAALKRGIKITIEPRGAIGIENALSTNDIEESDAVILMTDITLDTSRFHGKKIIFASTAQGVRNSDQLLDQLED